MSLKNILIPARAGSKGWVRKNLKLFTHTADIIPEQYRKRVIVTTDDVQIMALCEDYGFKVHHRDENLAKDNTDTKSTIVSVLDQLDYKPSDTFIMLYLTYPSRTWDDIQMMYNKFINSKSRSMLCRQPVRTHPYLTMYPGDNDTGKLVVDHHAYQRQQYPECFEISHYICMFRAKELSKLGKNMYNKQTKYYPIDRVMDIDSESDYKLYIKSK